MVSFCVSPVLSLCYFSSHYLATHTPHTDWTLCYFYVRMAYRQRWYGSILTAEDLRVHKTDLSTAHSASEHLSAHRHECLRAESNFCVREARIVSVTNDWLIREELCNYIWASNRASHARAHLWHSESPECKLKLRGKHHLFKLTWKWGFILSRCVYRDSALAERQQQLWFSAGPHRRHSGTVLSCRSPIFAQSPLYNECIECRRAEKYALGNVYGHIAWVKTQAGLCPV